MGSEDEAEDSQGLDEEYEKDHRIIGSKSQSLDGSFLSDHDN